MKEIGCAGIIFLLAATLGGGIWSYFGGEENGESNESGYFESSEEPLCTYETSCSETETTSCTDVATAFKTNPETELQTTTTETTTVGPSETYLGSFKGTYYRGNVNPCPGGSGRMLIDCAAGGMGVKGSVACRYVWSNYGYSYLGSRTVVRIEVASHPEMNGMYYVDDCCASDSVVDFYYPDYSKCPFQNEGVISCQVWVVE